MSEEDEQTINGGPDSAEMKEECREESRRSALFSPEAESHGNEDDKKDASDDETDAEDSASPADQPRTREELESFYRNDPRFTMLFEHEQEKPKKQKKQKKKNELNPPEQTDAPEKHAMREIKFAGVRMTPKRILILAVFFLVVLLCLGGSLFYAFKDIGKYRDYIRASALYDAGDYEGAREMFVKVLSEDPNRESALATMADIYHHYGDWGNEAFLRQRLMRLNPLKEEYLNVFLKSAFRARNFGTIYSHLNLRVMENPELPPEQGALFLVSALHTGHVSEGRNFYEARKKGDPAYFSSTELGRFAEMLLGAANMNSEQAQAYFDSLDDIQDDQVRFETINTLLYFVSKRTTPEAEEKMEELLLESAKLNDYAGAPMLANYYFSRYRFDDAIRVCDEYMKTKMNALIPVIYGESCFLGGKTELIPPLISRMGELRGRQAKMIAAYLQALCAFHDGDDALMRSSLMESGSMFETPVSTLMKFQMALQTDSPKEIRQTLASIMRNKPFLDFQERARTAALEYLLVKDQKVSGAANPDALEHYAEIAALIETPDDDLSFLRRIILLDRSNRRILKEDELQEALGTFPGDPVLLRIAAEFYLFGGQPDRALEYIAAYNALEKDLPDKLCVTVLHLLALDRLGRKPEAENEFRSILEHGEADGTLLYLYFEYCVENGFQDALKSLANWIDALPEGSGAKSALPFVRAEILFEDGQKEQALDLFAKTASDNPNFVFHAASRLAEAGRNDVALSRFSSIKDTYPDKALLNINLSELYFEKGDAASALSCAHTAWLEDRNGLQARYIYGKRLFEAGQYGEAISVLKFPQYKASFPEEMLKLWANAVREQIKLDFKNARYTPVQENLKHLLIYFPEDEFAQDYSRRMEIIRRQSKSRTQGAF